MDGFEGVFTRRQEPQTNSSTGVFDEIFVRRGRWRKSCTEPSSQSRSDVSHLAEKVGSSSVEYPLPALSDITNSNLSDPTDSSLPNSCRSPSATDTIKSINLRTDAIDLSMLSVKNTFLQARKIDFDSLRDFFQERKVKSCPASRQVSSLTMLLDDIVGIGEPDLEEALKTASSFGCVDIPIEWPEEQSFVDVSDTTAYSGGDKKLDIFATIGTEAADDFSFMQSSSWTGTDSDTPLFNITSEFNTCSFDIDEDGCPTFELHRSLHETSHNGLYDSSAQWSSERQMWTADQSSPAWSNDSVGHTSTWTPDTAAAAWYPESHSSQAWTTKEGTDQQIHQERRPNRLKNLRMRGSAIHEQIVPPSQSEAGMDSAGLSECRAQRQSSKQYFVSVQTPRGVVPGVVTLLRDGQETGPEIPGVRDTEPQLPMPAPPLQPGVQGSLQSTALSPGLIATAPSIAPVLRLADAIAPPVIGGPEFPSIGSLGHYKGDCRPCTFFHTRGCENEEDCQFCHLCGPGEKKKRLKALKAAQREATFQALEKAKALLVNYRVAQDQQIRLGELLQ